MKRKRQNNLVVFSNRQVVKRKGREKEGKKKNERQRQPRRRKIELTRTEKNKKIESSAMRKKKMKAKKSPRGKRRLRCQVIIIANSFVLNQLFSSTARQVDE